VWRKIRKRRSEITSSIDIIGDGNLAAEAWHGEISVAAQAYGGS